MRVNIDPSRVNYTIIPAGRAERLVSPDISAIRVMRQRVPGQLCGRGIRLCGYPEEAEECQENLPDVDFRPRTGCGSFVFLV
ncbi:Hypothetical protein NTJ_06937 [Nesidiocoris tenuis]|uniref:Uncharacterized protein n=1 Tax=Nesidiocoris tenuis TaxID=355587 RepID=A0ABN7APY0_9HEMI|nr:Hypothetical protein NTJ_06937 [Nesidiocoris tenuis]